MGKLAYPVSHQERHGAAPSRVAAAAHARPFPTPVDSDDPTNNEPVFIGAGRGARVYSLRGASGAKIAKKVFVGSGLARLVHQVIFGCDNPYVWDATAVDEAKSRRRVLNPLVSWWLKGKARVAEIFESGWNEDVNANEWTMEFIDGRQAQLRQPFSAGRDDEVVDLLTNVMKPLQRHLVDAGFDGAAWQAGLYNPVATSNFLRRVRGDGHAEWVWIDIESGVPALFPANPLGLFKYYLPRAFKFGRPMFDDVDVPKLNGYLAAHEGELRRDLGDANWETLLEDVRGLERTSFKSRWKGLSRVQRGIEARRVRHEITQAQADFFARHKALWILREFSIGVATAARAIADRFAAWFHPGLWLLICRESLKLMASDVYRTKFARNFVFRSLERWQKRKQLDRHEFTALEKELDDAGTAVYLTDFGMHLAAKPLVKVLTWGAVPILYTLGMMSEIALALLVVWGGAIARTLYTLMRITLAHRKGYSRPWIALFAGVLPVIGNVAFPLQLLFDGVKDGRNLSQFIVYDTASRVGQIVPIWGGADTLCEHRANRAADWLFALSRKFQRNAKPLRMRDAPN